MAFVLALTAYGIYSLIRLEIEDRRWRKESREIQQHLMEELLKLCK